MKQRGIKFHKLNIILVLVIILFFEIWCVKLYTNTEISFDVKAKKNCDVTVYWDNSSEGYSFDEANCARFSVTANQLERINLNVPYRALSKVRIDVGDSKNIVCRLSNIVVSQGLQRDSIESSQILEQIIEKNDISKIECDENSIKIKTSGQDCYIAIENLNINMNFLYNIFYIASLIVLPFFVWFLYNILYMYNKKIFSKENQTVSFHDYVMQVLFLFLDAAIVALVFDRVILVTAYKMVSSKQILLARYLESVQFISFPRIAFWFIMIFAILLCISIGIEKSFKYRYIISMVVFIFLVIGKYHGSSIGFLSGMLTEHTNDYDKTTLLGINQGLRGDEWAVALPLNLAQYYNDEKFPYYNYNLMIEGCDTMVSAKTPAKDLLALGAPNNWGYFFLPTENAVSFGWWFPLFALFLSSIEMMYELCKNKRISIVFAILITFSPCVQWWNGIIMLIAAGQYFVVALSRFLSEKNTWKKIGWTLFAALCAITYVFVLYPAWQVPFIYIYLILAFWVMWNKRDCKPFAKANILAYIGVLAICVVFAGRFLILSGDAMQTQLNTVYPGSVREWFTVPNDIFLLQIINVFMGFGKYSTYLNNCEISQFYGMFLWSLIAGLPIISKTGVKKNSVKLIIALVVCELFFMYYMFGPQIPFLYKIMLMTYSYPRRVLAVFGYGAVVLLMLILNESVVYSQKEVRGRRTIALALTVIALVFCINDTNMREYLNGSMGLIVIATLLIQLWGYTGYCIITRSNLKKGIGILLCVTMISSIFANPIQRGLDDFYKSVLVQKIFELNKENTGRWLVTGNSTISNIITACGVKRLTGTYVYPDYAMMEIIDPDYVYEDSWNRYAHIDMTIADKNFIESVGSGLNVQIDVNTAQALDVEYWVVNHEVDSKEYEDLLLEEVFSSKEWYIYKMNYQ